MVGRIIKVGLVVAIGTLAAGTIANTPDILSNTPSSQNIIWGLFSFMPTIVSGLEIFNIIKFVSWFIVGALSAFVYDVVKG